METLCIIKSFHSFAPRNIKALGTQDRILQGSKDLFFRFGLKSITMDDIASHLGISKKTIYQFFEDKNKLITVLNEQELRIHQEQFDQITNQARNAIDEIFHLMKHLHRIFSQMNPNVMYDMQKYHPGAWEQQMVFKEKCVFPKVEMNLKRGMSEGLYREDLNIRLMVIVRLEQINMAYNSKVIDPSVFHIGDVQVQLLDHFLHGITTLKGHKLINKYKQIKEEE